jgi:hypothetical protein
MKAAGTEPVKVVMIWINYQSYNHFGLTIQYEKVKATQTQPGGSHFNLKTNPFETHHACNHINA